MTTITDDNVIEYVVLRHTEDHLYCVNKKLVTTKEEEE